MLVTNPTSHINNKEGLNPHQLEQQLNQELGREIRNENLLPHNSNSELSLRDIDFKFAKALHHLGTVTEDYAYAPYETVFNWQAVGELLDLQDEGDWFVVAFRSIRSKHADTQQLYDADKLAHEEAIASGGLLKYWYGDVNEHRECLATCIWANSQFARQAIVKPLHRQAANLAKSMYDSYLLERYSIVKRAGDQQLIIQRLDR